MDMLISLTMLPSLELMTTQAARETATVRRSMSYERQQVIDWVARHFSDGWADECAVAFGRQPIGCYIAIDSGKLCGFCCLDSTYLNFIGPIGVLESMRSKGIGRILLLNCLHDMRTQGYAYAVAGHVGAVKFFERVAAAIPIPEKIQCAYPDPLA